MNLVGVVAFDDGPGYTPVLHIAKVLHIRRVFLADIPKVSESNVSSLTSPLQVHSLAGSTRYRPCPAGGRDAPRPFHIHTVRERATDFRQHHRQRFRRPVNGLGNESPAGFIQTEGKTLQKFINFTARVKRKLLYFISVFPVLFKLQRLRLCLLFEKTCRIFPEKSAASVSIKNSIKTV